MLIEKYILTATEAAAALGTSTQTVYNLLAAGILQGYKAPGHNAWKIPSAAVEEFARQQPANKFYKKRKL